MDFWKCASDAVTGAVDHLVEMNRRTAIMNRLKIVIRNERDNEDHSFVQLGKYYYHNLRDPQNGDTETYCAAIDKAASRLKRAYAKLDELAAPAGACPPEEGGGPSSGEADESCGFRPEDAPEEKAAEAAPEQNPAAAEPPCGEAEKPDASAPVPPAPVPPEADPSGEEAADDDADFLKPSGTDEPKQQP